MLSRPTGRGICVNIVTILVMLANSQIALVLSDSVSTFNKHLVRSLMGVDVRSFNVTGCRVFFFEDDMHKARRMPLHSSYLADLQGNCYNAFLVWQDTSIVQESCVPIHRTVSNVAVGRVLRLNINAYAIVGVGGMCTHRVLHRIYLARWCRG